MTGVFICPVDDESAAFGPALEIGCALGTVLPFINDAGEAEVMKNLYPGGHCHVWGVRDEGENRPVWGDGRRRPPAGVSQRRHPDGLDRSVQDP
ncbi:MAG: hypothetical protein IPI61_15360 [Syntrophaceae bacterium]|nr:hypothetical protein [Syntrophaceae bacterium]